MQTSDVLLGKIARDLNCLFDPHRGIRRRSIQKLKRILTTEPRSKKVTQSSQEIAIELSFCIIGTKSACENRPLLSFFPPHGDLTGATIRMDG